MMEKTCVVVCGRFQKHLTFSQWSRLRYSWSRVTAHDLSMLKLPSRHPSSYVLARHRKVDHVTLKHNGVCSMPTQWQQPSGYDTGIQVYHPIKKEKVPLILKEEKLAQWYTCGPTVYDSAHIGHASSYVRQDIIRRIMAQQFGIDTTLVMAVTDVDDKIIKRVLETGETMSELTKMYEAEFFSDMSALNVIPPTIVSRVTQNIPVIIDFVASIYNKGFAYQISNGTVYFDVNKYGKYGVFNISKEREEAPAAGIHPDKRSSKDFALWKSNKPGEPCWESPWGKGRPGWHIECSAMASQVFGENFDIHSGGEDLMFPHHENELAQSCAAHGNTQWVNYWLHTGHLFQPGQKDKMSKSLKNVVSVSDVLDKFTANQFRMLCLLSSYRKKIEFSDLRMQKAISTMTAFNSLIHRCEAYVRGELRCGEVDEVEVFEILQETRQLVEAAFADDFNTPRALAKLMRLVKFMNQVLIEKEPDEKASVVRSNAAVASVGIYLAKVMSLLGLNMTSRKESSSVFTNSIQSVVTSRQRIRDFAKDKSHMLKKAEEVGIPAAQAKKLMKTLYRPLWEVSDDMRDDLLANASVQIKDDKDGSTWSVVESNPRKLPSSS